MASRSTGRKPLRTFSLSGKKIGIAVAQWHNDITENLLKGALHTLQKAGINNSDITIMQAPGSFELPLVAQWLIKDSKVNAVLCLGCIIQGETPHFDFIAQATAKGIMDLNLTHNLPVVFGVLTTNTVTTGKRTKRRETWQQGY